MEQSTLSELVQIYYVSLKFIKIIFKFNNNFFIDEAGGTSHDYAQGKLKIPYSFLIELSPQNTMFNSGFLLPESEILNTGNEMWEAIKIIAEEIIIDNNNILNSKFKKNIK